MAFGKILRIKGKVFYSESKKKVINGLYNNLYTLKTGKIEARAAKSKWFYEKGEKVKSYLCLLCWVHENFVIMNGACNEFRRPWNIKQLLTSTVNVHVLSQVSLILDATCIFLCFKI